MPPTKLFITGGTGYIGGSILDRIYATHAELRITALLRNPREAFTAKYPAIDIVKGTFDDFDIIAKAAEQADIVVHAGDTHHTGCVEAILFGLSKRREKSLLVHLSGTSFISDALDYSWTGKLNPRVWNDINDVQEIFNIGENVVPHKTDKIIADASNDLIKTISICPPDIYGKGTGLSNWGTYLVPEFVKAIFDLEMPPFYVGEGENIRAVTYIGDVVDLFTLVIEKWLQGGQGLDFGKEGFYFAVADGVKWKDAAEAIAKIGHEQGWLPKETSVVPISVEQAKNLRLKDPRIATFAPYFWGSNTRAESVRAKKLGWVPKGPSFWEILPEDCRTVAEKYL